MTTSNDKTPLGKANKNRERFVYAKDRGHDKFIDKYNICDKFAFPFVDGYRSGQWEDKDLKFLQEVNRPALTINKIKPVILTMLGEYIRNRAEIKFIPATGGTPQIAEAITKLDIHISKEQKLRRKELTLVLEGLICSRAYYDVRIDFDDNFRGEVRVDVPNAKNVIPDPDSDSDDPDDWNDVILVSHQTIQDIEQNYGRAKANKVKDFGETITTADRDEDFDEPNSFGDRETHEGTNAHLADESTRKLYFVIERQYRSLENTDFFVNQVTGDERRVPVDWEQDDIDEVLASDENIQVERKRAQVIRWTVSTGSVLLHDAVSPYDAFTIVPFFPMFFRGKTLGPVEDMIDPQRNYNKLRSQELHIVNGTANSGWKVKQGALKNMRTEDLATEGSKTGVVFELDELDNIERIDPTQIPQGLDRISSKADSDIGTVSGIQDEARGIARADVAGKAIDARQQAVSQSFAPYMESLIFTREKLHSRILKLVQKYYDDERTLVITTGGLNPQTETLDVNTPDPETGEIQNDLTLGEYEVAITSTAQRDSHQNAQFEELKEMQEQGIPIPPHMFLENSSLDRKEELAEELRAAAGTATPSEEERQLQLEQQQLEMEEQRAQIAARRAAAALSQARAQKVLSEIEKGDLDETKIDELLLKARSLDNERARDEQSMEIRRRAQTAQEFQLLEELDLKRRELEQAIQDRRQQETGNATEDTQTPGRDSRGTQNRERRTGAETGGGGSRQQNPPAESS